MPISINKSSINFGTYSISLHPGGIEIDGKFKYGSYAVPPPPTQAQGSVSGYMSGGTPGPINIIQKFPFATDANATDVGDLTGTRWTVTGQSSDVSGYTSGGYLVNNPSNIIDKFPFATDGNATDVGDLTEVKTSTAAGQMSTASGYTSGGVSTWPNISNVIDKFPFASDANATDVGNLTAAKYNMAGQSSTGSGYISGGGPPAGPIDTIEKFPFATDINATDVGDLTRGTTGPSGQNSAEFGYVVGGANPGFAPAVLNTIEKFPFASDANATDVGDLTLARASAAGQSSNASGYNSGGSTTIDKFPFASDGNATDVGDLIQTAQRPAGQQV